MLRQCLSFLWGGLHWCFRKQVIWTLIVSCFSSIARTASVTPSQIQSLAVSTAIELNNPKEWKLAKLVLRFPEIIDRCVADLTPHTLCDYLYELATTFTEFYDACYVVEKDRQTGENSFSISSALCWNVANVLTPLCVLKNVVYKQHTLWHYTLSQNFWLKETYPTIINALLGRHVIFIQLCGSEFSCKETCCRIINGIPIFICKMVSVRLWAAVWGIVGNTCFMSSSGNLIVNFLLGIIELNLFTSFILSNI